MPIARKQQIDLNVTPFYHCISRCVRQAFLCGKSKQTGKNFEHRRTWVVSRLSTLAEIFAIKICAYAVMSNHYHLVLHVDLEAAKNWSDEEVIARWKRLFKGTSCINVDLITKWRQQLTNISWFMRCLNEHLARKANIEDGCKGRFWEGRYKSQALLDEGALLTCMAYVDLNPVRAKLCDSLEKSDFTSIQQRLKSIEKPKLITFDKNSMIHFDETMYFELVRWTGSAKREDKKGFIPTSIRNTLHNNGINEKKWLQSVNRFGTSYGWLVGSYDAIRERCSTLKKRWLRGMSASNIYFINAA